MNIQVIMGILIKLMVLILGIELLTFIPRIKKWINQKQSQEQITQIISYTKLFVEAAEQQLKDDDQDGSKRKQYVIEQLNAIGVDVSSQVNAIIEAQVLELNK